MTTPLQAVGLAALFSLTAASAHAESAPQITGENFFKLMFSAEETAQYFTPTKPSTVFVELASAENHDKERNKEPDPSTLIGRIDINYSNHKVDQATLALALSSISSLWFERQETNMLFVSGAITTDHTNTNNPQTPATRLIFGDSAFVTGERTPATSFGCVGNKFVVVAPNIKQVLLLGTMLHCATPDAYQKLKANGPQQQNNGNDGDSDYSFYSIAQQSPKKSSKPALPKAFVATAALK